MRKGGGGASECGPKIEKDLKPRQAGTLLSQRAGRARGSIRRARNRNHKQWTIELITKIDANRSNRSLIAEAETCGVREVVQLVRTIRHAHRQVCCGAGGKRGTWQCGSKRYTRQPAIDVAAIIEKRAAQRCSYERQAHREAKLLVQHQHGLPAHRKSSDGIAWPGLIQRKSPERRAAAPKEALGEGDYSWKRASC